MEIRTMEFLAKPFRANEFFNGEQFGRKIWWIKTNQGTFKVADIAKRISMTMQGLLRRINRDGFDHPEVLHRGGKGGWTDESRKRQRERKLNHMAMVWPGAESIPDSDIGKYENLSGRDRSYNLAKVRNPGGWEQRRLKSKGCDQGGRRC